MAQSDFLYAPEQVPGGNRDELPSRGPDSFLPYRRSDSGPGPGRYGPGVDSVDGLDLILPPRSAVNRSRPDKCCRTGVPDPAPASRRRLLWEVWDGYHCSICGTCLSFAELRKIAARAGLQFEPDESEHGIHGHFVQLAAKPGRVAKLIQKLLDRKYRNAVERFRRAKSEAQVADLWESRPDGGRRAGPVLGPHDASAYHHRPDDACIRRGAHALAPRRCDETGRTYGGWRALEGERQELAEQLAAARCRLSERETEHRRLTQAHEAEMRVLTDRLKEAHAAEIRLQQVEERLRNHEEGEAVRGLRARTTELASELDAARRELGVNRNGARRSSTSCRHWMPPTRR